METKVIIISTDMAMAKATSATNIGGLLVGPTEDSELPKKAHKSGTGHPEVKACPVQRLTRSPSYANSRIGWFLLPHTSSSLMLHFLCSALHDPIHFLRKRQRQAA